MIKLTEDIIWPLDASEAINIQKNLTHKVRIENDFQDINLIAGVDCSYDIQNNVSKAVIVLMNINDLKPLRTIIAHLPTTFPYIPGLLSFREIPVILKAFEQLIEKPDLLMVDGQGIAHPRGLGIAAHLGVLTDIPSIGVAKSRLTGKYIEPGINKGDQNLLLNGKIQIGVVLRSKVNTKPLFISPGHLIDHETSVKIVKQCLTKYRLPEPTRIADKISKIKEVIPKLI